MSEKPASNLDKMNVTVYIQKSHGGCDLFNLVNCEDCGKPYFKKINHVFGKTSFDKYRIAGIPEVTTLENGCDCEHDED